MGGKALPAGELAFHANVSAPTASNHLRRLLEAGLLDVQAQGRHRYYRLSCPEIAAAIEALWSVLPHTRPRGDRDGEGDAPRRVAADPAFTLLRRCHSHLAGSLAVSFLDRLVSRGFLLTQDGRACRVTPSGVAWFTDLGIPARVLDERDERADRDDQADRTDRADRAAPRAVRAMRCLDWTERRDHLAGPLGVAVLHRLVDLKWIAPVRQSRAMRVTIAGRLELERRLGLTVPRG